jgi:hypothetical protein
MRERIVVGIVQDLQVRAEQLEAFRHLSANVVRGRPNGVIVSRGLHRKLRAGRYSLLSTSIGSTRVAATAGEMLARLTTAIINRAATPYGIGSRLVIPNS